MKNLKLTILGFTLVMIGLAFWGYADGKGVGLMSYYGLFTALFMGIGFLLFFKNLAKYLDSKENVH
ncbi:hypothetical protein [Macrococcus animalis]|uniref:hypothetical protein n=1 Tax=Macrococcus animalis TaxID=3395467 RepID=UPI0039BE8ABA